LKVVFFSKLHCFSTQYLEPDGHLFIAKNWMMKQIVIWKMFATHHFHVLNPLNAMAPFSRGSPVRVVGHMAK